MRARSRARAAPRDGPRYQLPAPRERPVAELAHWLPEVRDDGRGGGGGPALQSIYAHVELPPQSAAPTPTTTTTTTTTIAGTTRDTVRGLLAGQWVAEHVRKEKRAAGPLLYGRAGDRQRAGDRGSARRRAPAPATHDVGDGQVGGLGRVVRQHLRTTTTTATTTTTTTTTTVLASSASELASTRYTTTYRWPPRWSRSRS